MVIIVPLEKLEGHSGRNLEIRNLWEESMKTNINWSPFVIWKFNFNTSVGRYSNGVILILVMLIIWWIFSFSLLCLLVYIPILVFLWFYIVNIAFVSLWLGYLNGAKDNDCFKNIVEYYELKDGKCWVAMEKDEIVGFVGFMKKSYSEDDEHYELVRMCVSPHHKRKGIGKKLMIELEEYRAERRICDEDFYFTSSNCQFPAIGFYKRMGFQFTCRTHIYPNIQIKGWGTPGGIYRRVRLAIIPMFSLKWTKKAKRK